jgi:uncharacterized phage-associated protein
VCSPSLANFFIEKAKEDKIEISNMQLQKLMFIGYGWVLSLTNKDLTETEGFEAWQHGPVLTSIYHEMKHNGNNPITSYATEYDVTDNKVFIPKIRTDQTKQILGKVWDTYKNFNAASLRNLTHETDTPWKKVYKDGSKGIKISPETVDAYYSDYITKLLG